MTEEQIELLENALKLYSFVLDQQMEDRYDTRKSNDFGEMVGKLSEIIGRELEYY